MKICHVTSVHSRVDTRIFLKECCSLVKWGYEVFLIVADGLGDEVNDGITIRDVGSSKGRIDRIRNVTRRVYEKAVMINAAIYHFHDPELIPVGLRLQRRGKKVIFDAHEDLPKQLLSKPYLNQPARWVLSQLSTFYENRVCGKFDAIVTATSAIRDKFLKINPNVVDINNFPMWGELASPSDWKFKRPQVCYIGGITTIRGVREIVSAMDFVKSPVRLHLAGRFSEQSVETEVHSYSGWDRVDMHGFVNREGVRRILASSIAGIVTFLPAPNHIDAQPNKMFEYMSAGIPVIGSHFPLWREIIEGNQCGICVDPLKPDEIARSIDYVIENPKEAETMGKNGLAAIQQRYNWATEEVKLHELYGKILGKG